MASKPKKTKRTATANTKDAPNPRVSLGVSGLDEVLGGGVLARAAYLIKGGPGSGKTTLGLHFLTAGVKQGERSLYISLSEPADQIQRNGANSGFDLAGVDFLDLSPSPDFFSKVESYDIFSSAEVEREPLTQQIVEAIEKQKPQRVFLDSMTQFRYLSTDVFQYRKQSTSFLRFLVDQGATVLFTSEGSRDTPDDDLKFIADGAIELSADAQGRAVTVTKFRGSQFRAGLHSMRLGSNGMTVYPSIVSTTIKKDHVAEAMSSGVPELDELMHGGLERGTVTILTGPTGSGKTTLGLQFIKEAAGRGERSVVYTFEEGADTLINRSKDINIPIREMVDQGTLAVRQIEDRYSPDEFAHLVRRDVEDSKRRIVMIDSVMGYSLCLDGRDFTTHLHRLGMYLKSVGVTLLLINEVESITGDFQATDGNVSYLSDNIIFLRYLELNGQLRKAIGILKKRAGDFEKHLREIEITKYGLKVGRPLTGLRGILTGKPEIVNAAADPHSAPPA